MLKLLTIAAFIATSSGKNRKEHNELSKRTDEVIIQINILYDNIAHTVEDSLDKQKRAFSIIITGLYEFYISGENTSITIDVDRPADVIVADYRSELDIFRVVLDPPINVIQRACPPEASAKQCAKALASADQEATEKCEGFPEHMEIFKETEELVNNPAYEIYIADMVQQSKDCLDDQAALKYFKDLMTGKIHKEVISKLMKWFASFADGNYPCNLPPGACASTDSNSEEICS